MPSLPPRDNRVLQAVDFLKQEIEAGGLNGALPGERELARRLSVSRITLRKAMTVLEDENWVSEARPGCRRKILKRIEKNTTATQAGCQGKTVVTLAPVSLDDLPSSHRLDHTRLNSYCARLGINLRHRALYISQLKHPEHRLREFVQQNPADLYLLLLSTREIQSWFYQQEIPCIVLGSVWPGSHLASADTDQFALGVHAASMLTRMGHRKVGVLYPDPEKRGMHIFLDGFHQNAKGMEVALARQDDSPDSVLKALLSLLSDSSKRPTALVLPRIPYVATAIALLPTMGIRVPEQMSLLCLVYDEVLQFFHPRVAGYHLPVDAYPKAIFDLVVKKLMHPGSGRDEHALVMPEYVSAQSMANASGDLM